MYMSNSWMSSKAPACRQLKNQSTETTCGVLAVLDDEDDDDDDEDDNDPFKMLWSIRISASDSEGESDPICRSDSSRVFCTELLPENLSFEGCCCLWWEFPSLYLPQASEYSKRLTTIRSTSSVFLCDRW